MIYFKAKECFNGKYKISPMFENLPLYSTNGSFNLIAARLMGLTYAQFLRYCRDVHEAEIVGKQSLYPVAYFTKEKLPTNLVNELNRRAAALIKERYKQDGKK